MSDDIDPLDPEIRHRVFWAIPDDMEERRQRHRDNLRLIAGLCGLDRNVVRAVLLTPVVRDLAGQLRGEAACNALMDSVISGLPEIPESECPGRPLGKIAGFDPAAPIELRPRLDPRGDTGFRRIGCTWRKVRAG